MMSDPKSRSKLPNFITSELDDDSIFRNISEGLVESLDEIGREVQFLNLVLHTCQIGPWEQFSGEERFICASAAWLRMFGKSEEEIVILEDYIDLIDDPLEAQKILKARENLMLQSIGTRWKDTFSICGVKIYSAAFVAQNGHVFGADVAVG